MQGLDIFKEWYENLVDWLSRRSILVITIIWIIVAANCVLLTELLIRV